MQTWVSECQVIESHSVPLKLRSISTALLLRRLCGVDTENLTLALEMREKADIN